MAIDPERQQDLVYKSRMESLFRMARTDFSVFVRLFRPPSANFIFSNFHRYLAGVVQDIMDEKVGKRQAVCCPPQHGKTEVTSKLAAAWIMGRKPRVSLAYTSHSSELCRDVSIAVRDIVMHPYYRLIFPNAEAVYGQNRLDSWSLTNGSQFRAKAAGSKFTGRRIDWLIVDDPHKGRKESESKVQRETVIKWYFADLLTRMSPGGTIFVIQTRWHPTDLVGTLTDAAYVQRLEAANAHGEIFNLIKIPALCTDPDTDPLGRAEGEPCFPEVRDHKFLSDLRQSIPPYDWEAQYQQRPRLTGSGNIDFEKIRMIDWEEVPPHLELLRHWDLALSEDQKADYTSGAMVAYDDVEDKLYIVHVTRARRLWMGMRREIIERAESEMEEYGVGRIGVEAVSGFGVAFQDLQHYLRGKVRVLATKPHKSKLARATPWMNKIEAGRVYMVRAAWNRDFLEELEQFPSGEHDDQVDAVTGGFELLAGRKLYQSTAATDVTAKYGTLTPRQAPIRPAAGTRPRGSRV